MITSTEKGKFTYIVFDVSMYICSSVTGCTLQSVRLITGVSLRSNESGVSNEPAVLVAVGKFRALTKTRDAHVNDSTSKRERLGWSITQHTWKVKKEKIEKRHRGL